MDRRQLKTRKAIFQAFRSLLEKKRYDHITVQEIIDEADVGRSTFYAHFETKDLLLDAMCEELFYHMFEHDPCPWVGRDADLEGKLAHILWHIRDSKNDLSGILLSDSGDLFMRYFKSHLRVVFEQHMGFFKVDVPCDFLLNHLVGSFAETVQWWIKEGMKTSPEMTAKYFMTMTETH
ncbi:MAG: TetR/AcrR family transcriptional regulator [Oscillospiraceae bacterium]|nr:TetR/AcrR family transcriptional regulator [Oscillospiraceae bacterium]